MADNKEGSLASSLYKYQRMYYMKTKLWSWSDYQIIYWYKQSICISLN